MSYRHLLNRPWEEMDCRSVVRAFFEECGVDLPAWAFEDPRIGCWEKVGEHWTDAGAKLDVIASDPEGLGRAAHVSVMTDDGRKGKALSSCRQGGTFACNPWDVRNVIGVYRLRPKR